MIGMMLYDQKGANYSMKEYVSTLTSWLPDQLNPTEPFKAAISWIPQIIKPILEVGFNKTTFPKVRDLESSYMQKLPAQFRYHDGTSVFAKWTGQAGVLSPIQIDHLLKGHFGRAVGYVTGTDTAMNPLSSLKQKRFFMSGRMMERFKTEKDEVEQMLISGRKGLLPLTEDQMVEYTAKKTRIQEIDNRIEEYLALSRNPEKEAETRALGVEIWNDINNYFNK